MNTTDEDLYWHRITADQLRCECSLLLAISTKPELPRVRELIAKYKSLPENTNGGALHVVLEDGNVRDSDIEHCMHYGNAETALLGRVLLLLSPSQRRRL